MPLPPFEHAGPPTSEVFLPFEGDLRLSTILSKALLFAGDRSITDPTITRQLAFSGR
jgi:hypothetical protein